MLGTYALSAGYYDAYYVKAQQVRTLIKAEFDRVLDTVDALLAPTSPTVAFKIGAKTDDPLLMYLNDVCTLPVNIAGLPGISVPAGSPNGLPVGLQVIGRAFDEATVLRVADAYERDRGLRHPPAADRARLTGSATDASQLAERGRRMHLLRDRARGGSCRGGLRG